MIEQLVTVIPLLMAGGALRTRPESEIEPLWCAAQPQPDGLIDHSRIFVGGGLILETEAPATQRLPAWIAPAQASPRAYLQAQLDSFGRLSPGWDGMGTDAPSEAAIGAAKAFIESLPAGLAYPTPMVSSAGPEVFWDGPGGYVDVRFDADGTASIYAEASDGEPIYADHLPPDFRRFPQQSRLLALLAPHLLTLAA